MSSTARNKQHRPLFALVDCNNFYASCERVFNPKLIGKPVVVLSNNDGCVIARSKEAKALGIPMGAPAFQYAELFKREKVIVCSSNFALYGDMSNRVMRTLEYFACEMQIYSIDEAFLLYEDTATPPQVHCKMIRKTILQWTGIPVSIGISQTKTLAKAANHIAKKDPSLNGVFAMDSPVLQEEVLKKLPVEEIWGIGRQTTDFLNRHSIKFAWDLVQADDGWIKKHLNVCALRTAWELRGISCLEMEETPSSKKSIMSSRSFGYPITALEELCEAIASYTACAAEKLREEGRLATILEVFLTTSPHAEEKVYANKAHIKLPQATAFTPTLIHYAKQALESIYRPGHLYKKTGVLLYGLVSDDCFQPDLFAQHDPRCLKKQQILMQLMDNANLQFGYNVLKFAAEGVDPKWKARQTKRSPFYTTRWDDLLTINI